MLRVTATAALVTIATGLAACGGGGGDESGPSDDPVADVTSCAEDAGFKVLTENPQSGMTTRLSVNTPDGFAFVDFFAADQAARDYVAFTPAADTPGEAFGAIVFDPSASGPALDKVRDCVSSAGGSGPAATTSFAGCVRAAGFKPEDRTPEGTGVIGSFAVDTPDELVTVNVYDTRAHAAAEAKKLSSGTLIHFEPYGPAVVTYIQGGPSVDKVVGCAKQAAG